MKKYLLILFTLFLFIPKANALVNNNTTWEVTMPNYNQLLNFYCGSYNFKEEFDNLISTTDFSSLNFDIALFARLDPNNDLTILPVMDIYFYPKNNIVNNLSIYSVSNQYLAIRNRNLPFDSTAFNTHISFDSNSCSDLSSNQDWITLTNAINTNTMPSLPNEEYEFPDFWRLVLNPTITNDSSFSFTYWYYYSSNDLYYTYGDNYNTDQSNLLFKKLHIVDNDSYYTINNSSIDGPLPSYYDLYKSNYNILLDKNNITNMLVGNITDLYNFSLNLRFFYDNYDYINNMTANYRIYGRKNNSTYYSYEDLTSSCSAINGHKLDKNIDTDLNYAQFEYFSQGIACNPNLDLTQYDNFYLDIQTFATSGNYFISYLEYNSTNGNVYFPNSSSYSIYDTFTNLPSDFSLLITTDYSQRQVNVVSDNKYVLGCIVNLYRLSTGGACASPSEIGSLTNLGYMIYKYPEDTSNSVDLSILTSFDSIISYGSNGTGDNSSYTYYDESGTITTGVINNTITLNYNTDNYDISDYFGIVNDYIDFLSSDITNFSTLVQNFYDSAPQFMQIFLYIVFIIMCTYFVYLMIRK